MPAEFVATFKVSDSGLNRRSERILTPGIDLTDFLNNPVAFYNHHRSSGWQDKGSTEIMPIGYWDNLRTEGDALYADLYVDMDDGLGKTVASKIKNGVLRACSVSIRPTEYSDAAEHVLPGQRNWTITKCELREISVVDIPGNQRALVQDASITEKNYRAGDDLTEADITYYSTGGVHHLKQENMSFFKGIAKKLNAKFGFNLPEDADQQAVEAAIENFKFDQPEGYVELQEAVAKQAGEYESLAGKLSALERQLEQYKTLPERLTGMDSKLAELETANTLLQESNTSLKGKIAEMKGGKDLRGNSQAPHIKDAPAHINRRDVPVTIIEE